MSIRMRHTKGHTGNRRSHHALSATKSVVDKESGKLRLPHRLDESTGMYRGKLVKEPKTRTKHAKATSPRVAEAPHSSASVGAREKHENAEVKGARGIINKFVGAGRPKARSGMGGGA